MNILVPTDFSEVSRKAVQYAIKLANNVGGQVTLLHVIDLKDTLRSTLSFKRNSRNIVEQTQHAFEKMMKAVEKKVVSDKAVKFKIAKASAFSNAINTNAKKLKANLVVMGTHGASGLKKTLLGSNTTTVIGATQTPVLAIPGKADYKTFRNIVYATDTKRLEKELKLLIPFAKPTNSVVHIVHVLQTGDLMDEMEERINKVLKKINYDHFVVVVTVDSDIDGAIAQYASVAKADLLVMFTHTVTLYERLMDKSVTRKMAFHSKIPLLAFRQK